MIFFQGRDDEPREAPDLTDDFSGEEPYFVPSRFLDPCGEPLFHLPLAELRDGDPTGSGGSVFVRFAADIPLRPARAMGRIAARGTALSLRVCGAATIHDLGRIPNPDASGLTLLEVALGVRGQAGRCRARDDGRKAEVIEDTADHLGVFDRRDQTHPAAAAGALEDVDVEGPAHQVGPLGAALS